MTPFHLAALLLVLVAAIGWLNVRLLHLPTGVAMVLAGSLGAAGLLLLRWIAPGGGGAAAIATLGRVDFTKAILDYLLAFLLFAGALQVDLAALRRRALAIWTLATLGVMASTAIVGGGLWLGAKGLGVELPLPWALVFGALISPTDPIAVLAAVRNGGFSKPLQSVLQGEALFNDGVGVVIFSAAVAVAAGGGELHPLTALAQVGLEAAGGLLLGLALGWIAILATRAIDDYAVEVAITLALAAGAYSLAQMLEVSGPIAAVGAGLLVGDRGVQTAMSDTTRRYVRGFWALVDEILNAAVFLLLGLELAVLGLAWRDAGLWLLAIALVLAARLVVVAPWGAIMRLRREACGATPVLVWGGLHGALSLALALSLPDTGPRDRVLSVTYAVVLFSVVVQGLTFPAVARRLGDRGEAEPAV
jgi:CPA1 family monovalent cation:H+ antiporter